MACSLRKVKKKKESSSPVSLWCDFRSCGAVGTTLRGSGKPRVARRLPGIFSIARKKCSCSPPKGARPASYGAAGCCSTVTALSLIGVIGCLHLLFKKCLMHGCSSATAVLAFAFPCLSLLIFSSLCLKLAPQLKCEACWQLTSNYCTMKERNICQS